jgi:hypothetical protein
MAAKAKARAEFSDHEPHEKALIIELVPKLG